METLGNLKPHRNPLLTFHAIAPMLKAAAAAAVGALESIPFCVQRTCVSFATAYVPPYTNVKSRSGRP
jgi:hypothetical protein